jgi:hypothetical protein
MRRIDTEVVIRGTAEQVWSVLVDFGRYAAWNPFIREASGEASVGTRLRVRIHPPNGTSMTFTPTVLEAAPARELRWLGHFWLPGLFDGEHAFRIEAAAEGHVRLSQSEVFRGLLVLLLPATMYERTRRGFDAMNRALKERVETLYG